MKIDLGSAKSKPEGYIGVDIRGGEGVDIVHDCEKGFPFEDNCADEIRSYDFIEHISSEKKIFIFDEIYRVLKPGGIFVGRVPDASKGQGAMQDPTHKSLWVPNSFKYYANSYYRDLYEMKSHFTIQRLESVEEDIPQWGPGWWIYVQMTAVKGNGDEVVTPTVPVKDMAPSKAMGAVPPPLPKSNLTLTTDDLTVCNIKHFEYWDLAKKKYPNLKVIAFTIAKKDDNPEEDVGDSKEFKEFYEKRKDWLEIQPHGLTHERPQLGWLPYDEQKKRIEESIRILKPYLPEKIIYRFPGFRTMPYSEKILKELGVAAIAHREHIKYFNTGEMVKPLFNTHCTDSALGYENSIGDIWHKIVL